MSILNKNQAHAFTETLIIDISALSALNNDFISTAPIYSFIETNSALFQMVWFPFIFHHFYRLFGYISTILFNATIYFLFKVASQLSLTMANFYDRLHIESAIRRLTEPKQTGTNLGLNICFSLEVVFKQHKNKSIQTIWALSRNLVTIFLNWKISLTPKTAISFDMIIFGSNRKFLSKKFFHRVSKITEAYLSAFKKNGNVFFRLLKHFKFLNTYQQCSCWTGDRIVFKLIMINYPLFRLWMSTNSTANDRFCWNWFPSSDERTA